MFYVIFEDVKLAFNYNGDIISIVLILDSYFVVACYALLNNIIESTIF